MKRKSLDTCVARSTWAIICIAFSRPLRSSMWSHGRLRYFRPSHHSCSIKPAAGSAPAGLPPKEAAYFDYRQDHRVDEESEAFMIQWVRAVVVLIICLLPVRVSAQNRLRANDLLRMRSVGEVQLSPDGTRIAYTIVNNDGEGRPYSQLWLIEPASSKMTRVGGETHRGGRPTWSPDGTRIAFIGQAGNQSGLFISRADGSGVEFLAPMLGTNSSALVNTGEDIAWAPDGKQIAFVHATPGPESAEAEGDPMVITRYLYKPTFSEGNTRFNDNRRLHIFAVDLNTKRIRQLTDGLHYEHSIDWSPDGEELAFVS